MSAPLAEQDYYVLTRTERGKRLGIDEFRPSATPRAVMVADPEGSEPGTAVELLKAVNDNVVRLVRVTPQGDVRPATFEGVEGYFDADAWIVGDDEPIASLFGPQGNLVIEAIAKLSNVMEDDGDPEAEERYDDAVNAQFEGDRRDDRDDAVEASETALEKVGVDTYWLNYAFSCTYGTDMVALIARDLIGTVDGWTKDAYNLLMAPYRAAFGAGELPLPDDAK